MLISACYIVKNEEKNLAISIDSIIKVIDELIIVDTGSTDKTLSIARTYTDKIYTYNWQDNFAAARNFALSKANGNWIIFLDADEHIVNLNRVNLRNILQNINDVDRFFLKLINIDADQDNKILDSFFVCRIFRNRGTFYQGAIHEKLVKKSGVKFNDLILPEKLIYILHTGYSSLRSEAKAERNMRLLQKNDTNRPERLIELAEAYNGLGNKKKALYYANKAVQYGRQPITYASRPYRLLIDLLGKMHADKKALMQAIKIAMLDFPQMPDFCAEYAMSLSKEAQYQEAIFYMQKALTLNNTYKDIETSIFDNTKKEFAEKIVLKWKKIIVRATDIKISACMICKNEEKNILHWYNSIKNCSDEQIVVDTGSTDNTLKILKKLPVKICHYQWNNNFSAAKNYALDKAKGDWIIFLDADESFDKKSISKVRMEIANADIEKPKQHGILTKIINIEKENNRELSRFYGLRIFRKLNGLCYNGAIHEELCYSKEKKLSYVKNDLLLICHTGYSLIYNEHKGRRNLSILLSPKYQKNGIVRWHYIADAYFNLKEYSKAATACYKYFTEAKYKIIGGDNSVWNTYIKSMFLAHKSHEKVWCVIHEAITACPKVPDIYALAGIIAFQWHDMKKAEKYLLKSLKINECSNALFLFDTSFMTYLPTVYACLNKLRYLKGNKNDKNISLRNN